MPDYSEEDLEMEPSIIYNEELKPEEFLKLLRKYVNFSSQTKHDYPYCALMKLMSQFQSYENWSETDDGLFSSNFFKYI